MASEWLTNGYHYLDDIGNLTFSEKRALAKARAAGWSVKRGDRYERATCVDSGTGIYEFVAIPEISAICLKYDIYEE